MCIVKGPHHVGADSAMLLLLHLVLLEALLRSVNGWHTLVLWSIWYRYHPNRTQWDRSLWDFPVALKRLGQIDCLYSCTCVTLLIMCKTFSCNLEVLVCINILHSFSLWPHCKTFCDQPETWSILLFSQGDCSQPLYSNGNEERYNKTGTSVMDACRQCACRNGCCAKQ